MPSSSRRNSAPSVHLLNTNLMSKAVGSAFLHFLDRLGRKALGVERSVVDRRRLAKRAVADGIDHDLGDVAFAVAEHAQGFRHGAVDDLEVAAAGELLEFHQRKIWLDAGGVAVHHQADGAGRCDDARLRIAIAVGFAELQRAIPGELGALGQRQIIARAVGQRIVFERLRRCRDLFIAGAFTVGRAAMIAHDAQHGVAVFVIAPERAKLGRHFRGRRIGHAGHDGRQRAANRAAGFGVVGDAGRHQEPADIGVTEPQRAEVIRTLRDLARGELRHQHRDFEHNGPQPHRVLVALDVEQLLRPARRRGGRRRGRRAGSTRRDCTPCRRGTYTPSTGSMRRSGRTPGRCASR